MEEPITRYDMTGYAKKFQGQTKVCVLGHSHMFDWVKFGDPNNYTLYINTGTCSYSPYDQYEQFLFRYTFPSLSPALFRLFVPSCDHLFSLIFRKEQGGTLNAHRGAPFDNEILDIVNQKQCYAFDTGSGN